MTPLQNRPCPQWPELLLPVEYGHLENLMEGYFSKILLAKQYQDKRLNTHKLEQSATILEALSSLPGALIFLLRGPWSDTSCHKVLDDAFSLLHTACSEQQGVHLVVWQSGHSAAPRFSDCQQSYIKHETSGRTDWQHPVTYKAELVRHHQLLDVGK